MIEKSFRDTAAELKIVSYMLRKDYLLCDKIDKELFSTNAFKIFFTIISEQRTTLSQNILKELVAEKVENPNLFNPYFQKIYKYQLGKITRKSIDIIIPRLKKLSALRISAEKMDSMILALEEKDINKVKKIAKEISSIGVKNEKAIAGEYIEDFKERKQEVKNRLSRKWVGIPTGIQKLDEKTGGIIKGELAIIAGESSIGKSIALESFGAHAWKENYNVLFVSLEMPKMQVQFRMDSMLFSIQYNKFRTGNFTEKELLSWERSINKEKQKKENFFEIVCFPRGCSAFDIENHAEKIQDTRKKKIDLIVVDYLNIMKTNKNYETSKKWESQVDIAWELKELAGSFNSGAGVPLWSGNQIVDAAEGVGLLNKKDIKYARGIVEVANIVLGLTQDQEDKIEDIMKLQIIKVRDVKEIKPIILRPDFDIMLLNRSIGSLKKIGKKNG